MNDSFAEYLQEKWLQEGLTEEEILARLIRIQELLKDAGAED